MYVFGGLPLIHAAWFLLSVPITLAVARVAGPLVERALRIPRGLLVGSVARMPWRLGFTAGALMVAVSILVSTRSNGDAIIRDLRERVRFADGFVFCTSGLSKDEQARIRALPGVADALPVGYLPLRVAGDQVFGVEGMGPSNVVCVGFEPRPFLAMNRLDWVQGTPEDAIPRLEQGDAILVAPEFLVARGLGVGSRIRLGSGANEAEFEIVGVVTAGGLDIATQTFGMRQIYMEQAVSCVFMDFGAVERHFDTRDAYIMQLKLDSGLSEEDEKTLETAVPDAVPGAVFSSGRAIRGFGHRRQGARGHQWRGAGGARARCDRRRKRGGCGHQRAHARVRRPARDRRFDPHGRGARPRRDDRDGARRAGLRLRARPAARLDGRVALPRLRGSAAFVGVPNLVARGRRHRRGRGRPAGGNPCGRAALPETRARTARKRVIFALRHE